MWMRRPAAVNLHRCPSCIGHGGVKLLVRTKLI
jgi:hypothetical protein